MRLVFGSWVGLAVFAGALVLIAVTLILAVTGS